MPSSGQLLNFSKSSMIEPCLLCQTLDFSNFLWRVPEDQDDCKDVLCLNNDLPSIIVLLLLPTKLAKTKVRC